MDDAKEVTIPTVLLLIAVGGFAAAGYYRGGAEGVGITLLANGLYLLIGVSLGIVACFVTASLLSIAFGPIGRASLKLAATFAFPAAVSLFIPYVGWLVSLILYLMLLGWFFELEPGELAICAFVIFVVRFVALLLAFSLFL